MSSSSRSWRRFAVPVLLSLTALAGCGGGGGGASTPTAPTTPTTPAVIVEPSFGPAGPSASFAQQCAPANTLAAAALRTASLDTEKKWLRAYIDEAYLWRDEVPPVDPALAPYNGSDAYAALNSYFDALLSPKLTDTGQARDRFSFTYPTEQWRALSQGGVEAGYGIEWKLTSATPPRRIRIAYVESGSPAAQAGLARGDELLTVDGISADDGTRAGVDVLNAGLFPSSRGSSHAFVFQRGTATLQRTLVSADIARTPVPQARVIQQPTGVRVGYLQFNEHVLTAEAQLISAISSFRRENVTELVLDLRYNGGGYLFIASELAQMIAGPTRTAGQVFETQKYSAKRAAENESMPFYSDSCIAVDGRCTDVQPLPTLNLNRVYVLAQSSTCSASESIINGLRGINVEVVLIGGKTCGKPYGFTAKDNCGVSYFPIEFAGVNAKGFGDYADGFEPGAGATARFVPGCTVTDDLDRALGDAQEGMLAAALTHLATGKCPVQPTGAGSVRAQQATDAAPLLAQRHPARNNRLLLPR